MRMVWHCLSARARLEFDEPTQQQNAMNLALKKPPPREVALMAILTVNAPLIVPLEQQIQEGMYLKDHLQLPQLKSWILSSPDKAAANAALEALSSYSDE